MIVIFGGRSNDQSALNDTWGILKITSNRIKYIYNIGLRRHRDGRWDWVKAPYKMDKDEPIARYQHSSIFLGSAMLIVGGRANNVEENLGLEIYDTETSEWHKF